MHKNVSKFQLSLIITLTALLLTSCVSPFRPPPRTSAEYCEIDLAQLAQPPRHETVIEVWASAPRQHCLRAYAPWIAAAQHPELEISVKVSANNINADPYRDELLSAAAQGVAPDISFLYHYHLPYLLKQDYLYPLEECRQQPILRDIPEKLWTTMSPDGKAWGVPFELESFLLYYNKAMLRQLGWSEAAIQAFPHVIASGEFDFTDLLNVAEKAVASGVVRSGLAFVPHPKQRDAMIDFYRAFGGSAFDRQGGHFVINQPTLHETFTFFAALHRHNLLDTNFAIVGFGDWGNNVLLRDAVAHGRVLFSHGYASDWQQMVMDYTDDEASKSVLEERIGVALLPTHSKRQNGTMFGIDLNSYVIFNEKASGRRNQAAACLLLATLHNTNLAQLHADKTSQPTVRTSEIVMPDDWQQIGMRQIVWRPDHHPDYYRVYAPIIAEMGVAVEGGKLSAEEATKIAIQQLQEELGDQLVVE